MNVKQAAVLQKRQQNTFSFLMRIRNLYSLCSTSGRYLHVFHKRQGLPWWLSGKESICQCRSCRRCGFDPWVGKIPWRRKWQPTLVFLPGKSLWTEEPGRLQPIVSQRVRHDWAYTRSFPDQLSFSADAQMKGLSSKRSALIFQKRLFGIFSPKLLL